ncbi:MAG: M48 family metallopeptidase [Deltaproteobacteria bacterium]|nr:M48 family metallopeptidase [Deltaproteobacteria bacterium]
MAKLFFILTAFFLTIQGCSTVPYTERQQIMMVSEGQESQIGATLFNEVKQESKLSGDARINSMVSEVGRRIAAAADKPDYKWEFVVIEDKSVNAFALPGGKVAFNTGIIPICQDEAGIAAVMGHEVAHALARHGSERMSQQQALSIGGVALMAAVSGRSPAVREGVMQAYGLGSQVGVLLPYSRKHELEADRIGMILMAKAGYDPRQAVSFWERMLARKEGSAPPQFLSTHPSDQKRIEELKSFLPEALKYYKGR